MPCRPRSPSFFHRSAGNRLSWSIAAARGAISSAAKLRTVSRSISMVSPRSKLRPGSWVMGVSFSVDVAALGCCPGDRAGGAAPAKVFELGQQPLLRFGRCWLCSFTWPKPRTVCGRRASSSAAAERSAVSSLRDPAHQRLELADRRALAAPLRRVAEDVERRAAQALGLGEPLVGRGDPRAVRPLDQVAVGVALREQRRRQVEAQRVVALELLRDAVEEAGLDVQARDLVLVLVGHQLVQAHRHLAGKPVAAGALPARALRSRARSARSAAA